jgi:hypothetical protein
MIDVIITSMNRHDLLKRTLDSLVEINNYPINQVLIFEDAYDGLSIGQRNDLLNLVSCYEGSLFTLINLGGKVGQLAAIDELYDRVETEFVLHLEDDWETLKDGFIAEAIEIMNNNPNIVTVSGRGRELRDFNGHPNKEGILDLDFFGWSGWSYAPSMHRLSDYRKIGSYSTYTKWNEKTPWEAEKRIGNFYKNLNQYSYVTETKYFQHIGNNRSTLKR